MEKYIGRKLLIELTEKERWEVAERYQFQESDHFEIDTLYAALYPLIEAEVYYRILPEPEKGRREAVCVVTLGSGIDAMQESYMQAEEVLYGYMLDCLGNAMLEKAYRQVEDILLEETGLYAGTYHFPEDKASLEHARDIVKEMSMQLPNMLVGCNEACMMQPKKSVVYTVSLKKEKEETCICDGCMLETCLHRRGKKMRTDVKKRCVQMPRKEGH